MKVESVICFDLLGTFSYALSEGEDAGTFHAAPKKAGKKTLSFLEYMIINHSRNISREELTDTFWKETESRDPANALRNMLYKVRSLLKEMFPEVEGELLRTFCGCYIWNPDVTIELDTEKFEKACSEARKHSGKKSIAFLRQAASLYKGEFLAGNDSDWARGMRQYYRALYLDVCKSLLPLLEEEEEWMEIVSICGQAYQVDYCVEEFTCYQMRAFISMGKPEYAIERYEELKERMLEDLGMPPTECIEQIHSLAQGLARGRDMDEGDIFRLVCGGEPDTKAFFCSFSVFQRIVALERRHLARSGTDTTLVIVRLDKGTAQTADIKRLERILADGLRTGDPVARLTAGSYIVMLSGADEERSQIVTNRIDCSFHRVYRHSNVRLLFRISALHPQEAPPGSPRKNFPKEGNSDQIFGKNNSKLTAPCYS